MDAHKRAKKDLRPPSDPVQVSLRSAIKIGAGFAIAMGLVVAAIVVAGE
jgi:hypothetical protein